MIYLVADVHGPIRLPWLKGKVSENHLGKDDTLIILGDAGIVWDENDGNGVIAYYNSLECSTLFIDGNHENFDLLESYPVIELFGGKVHEISPKIHHLMRGEIYSIDGKTLFVFGGGFSSKKLTHDSAIPIWDREMPNRDEYLNGLANLEKHEFSVDYILTHVAPTSAAVRIGRKPLPEEVELNDYLENLYDRVIFCKWYYGHYHSDFDEERLSLIFERMIKLGD